MNVILALCLLALAPLALWCRSADARAAPSFATPHSSESWESDESSEDVLDQQSFSSKRNFAELLLPYLQREVSAEHHSKKAIKVHSLQSSKEHSGAWPRLNSHKKHVVEITPLRGKGRNGKPLAYILAPAKSNVRQALAKRLDKHHADHEHKDHEGHAPKKSHTKPNEMISEEDTSEEVTVKAAKLISLEETIELGSASAEDSEDSIILDKTTSYKVSKKPSSSENVSKEESVLLHESRSLQEQKESDSNEDSSKDGSNLPEGSKESTLNKEFPEEENVKSDKLLGEPKNSVNENSKETEKADRSMSIDETNESKSSKDDTEEPLKLDRTTSLTETEESSSSDDVKEVKSVNLDKILSSEESKPRSRVDDTKEDLTSQIETKESSSVEVDTKEETEKSEKAVFGEPSESRLGEDVTTTKPVKLDSTEKTMSVEVLTTSKESKDQTDIEAPESFIDESHSDHKSDSEEPVVETRSVSLISNENEESNDKSGDISEKQDSDVNVSDASKISSSIEDSDYLENYDKQLNNKNHLTEEKSLGPQQTEVKTAKDKFTPTADVKKSSMSRHESADERKHLSHTHNYQNYSEIDTEDNLSESQSIEESDSQQTQDIQVKKTEPHPNKNAEHRDQDKTAPKISDNSQEERGKDHNEPRFINHHNHRHYKENHEDIEHENSDSAEDSSVRRSHKYTDKQKIAEEDDINDTIPEENEPDDAYSKQTNEKERNAKEINENKAAKKVPNVIADEESVVDNHPKEISRNAVLEQPQSEIPTVTNKNEVNESDKLVENSLEEETLEILTPDYELKKQFVESKVEKPTGITTIEELIEESKTGQNVETTPEESTEHGNILKSGTSNIDTDLQTEKPIESKEAKPVLKEIKSESLVKESKTRELAAKSEIEFQDPEEKSETEESEVGLGEDDIVKENFTNLIERKKYTKNKSEKLGKHKIVQVEKLIDTSSEEDLEVVHTHSKLYAKSSPSKLPHNGIVISQQDGYNNIWEPAADNVIEMVQSSSPSRHSREEDPSDKAKVHKSYRLSFLFNKK